MDNVSTVRTPHSVNKKAKTTTITINLLDLTGKAKEEAKLRASTRADKVKLQTP